jgi:hypothetical protein
MMAKAKKLLLNIKKGIKNLIQKIMKNKQLCFTKNLSA